MWQRTLFSIPAFLLLIFAAWILDWFIIISIALLALISEYEMINTIKQTGRDVYEVQLYIFTVLLIPSYLFLGLFGALFLSMIFVMLLLIQMMFDGKDKILKSANSLFIFIYPQFFYLFLIALVTSGSITLMRLKLLITFCAAITSDSFALFIGKLFGKHKLCPNISPKKTIEGAIGGIISGYIVVMILGYIANKYFNANVSYIHFIILGAILPAISQVGDLVASAFKRECKVKDFGTIMPGHGGIMDRLDSSLFISPVVYFYFFFFIG
ncbi:MAG: phosphatidate cytidylyltransferase [Eubacteriales bacterium]